MADVIIRQAQPEDAGDIYEIEQICFPDPWSLDSIRYAGLWWVLDEGHITNVAVRPGYRNRKIAEGILSVLLEHTIEQGILHHTLEVRRSNDPAINLYEKFGFETCGVRKGYYRFGGEDALIMWRHEPEREPEEDAEKAAAEE